MSNNGVTRPSLAFGDVTIAALDGLLCNALVTLASHVFVLYRSNGYVIMRVTTTISA
ncbi:hypothetical protein J2X26_001682 [Cellulomonas humilata]|uniref:Uncharacterized protein n=1 Tax=Cellulomonas humilata TaxID=144055 RepID=A0ABU0EE70_9CELL|nr:hypothetical protein [Cellulomonas humilata]